MRRLCRAGYSYRITSTGTRLAARRAGETAATMQIAIETAPTTRKFTGSTRTGKKIGARELFCLLEGLEVVQTRARYD